jgi:arginase
MPAPTFPPGTVTLLGVPLDENSSFLRGAAQAPQHIRQALHSPSANLCTESGLDLAQERRWLDLGDLELSAGPAAMAEIEAAAAGLAGQGARPLFFGGDHSVTHPLVAGLAQTWPGLNILHLDAHSDLYDEFEGSRASHACPFARIMEAGLAARLVQVGIRTLTPHQRRQAERFGVEIIEMRHFEPGLKLSFSGPLFVSLDLDVLDPAFAPGVSHHEPGGLSTREVIHLIQQVQGECVGADLVELNPTRDPAGISAMAAAKLAKELIARLLGG